MPNRTQELLLVDDDPSGVELTVHVSRQYQAAHPIRVAEDGVDGLEVLKAIRADPRTRAIPVVILTSSREPRDVVEAYGLGANGFLQKPVDFDEFRKVVNHNGALWLDVHQPPPSEAFASDTPPPPFGTPSVVC